jgi:16S rRNA (cytosine1402-N4)-methyltransferase
MFDEERHTPVLLRTALDALSPQPGENVLDVTLGLGGHARAFLEATAPHGRLIGLDADARNLADATVRLQPWRDRLELHHINFGKMATLALPPLSLIFADLGLSSPHVDDPARGFSFRQSGPLDLRFDQSTGRPASEFLQDALPADLVAVFREYGELHREAHRLAEGLAGRSFATTLSLASAVESLFGFRAKRLLPQVFQALRIAVNDELHMLDALLADAPRRLAPGGRLGIISFHSLEDRRVKQAFRSLSAPIKDPFTGTIAVPATFAEVSRRPLVASEEEIADNPRARSAKLRVLRRILP